MSTQKPSVTIVGLGLIGTSIGLALRREQVTSSVVGHDKDPAASARAKKAGAVDKTEWNLVSACEKAELVILATPLGAVRDSLQAIGPHLHPGTVVADTAALKVPVLAWADELLPEETHFVGSDPILSGIAVDQGADGARADLFKDRLFCIVPSPRAASDAVKLVLDLVTILGARPLFYDAAEHDGLMAAVDELPPVLGLALLETASAQPAWREQRKLAGSAFEAATYSLAADPAGLSAVSLSNRENLVRWLDLFSSSLDSIRQALVDSEPDALTKRFAAAQEERARWFALRAQPDWGEGPQSELPPRPSMGQMFFGGLWRRKPKKES